MLLVVNGATVSQQLDRRVPFLSRLEAGVGLVTQVWDGFDVCKALARCCDAKVLLDRKYLCFIVNMCLGCRTVSTCDESQHLILYKLEPAKESG